jgi:hypothetical protein
MLQTLDQPLPPAFLKEAVMDFTIEASARHYLDVLLPPLDAEAPG